MFEYETPTAPKTEDHFVVVTIQSKVEWVPYNAIIFETIETIYHQSWRKRILLTTNLELSGKQMVHLQVGVFIADVYCICWHDCGAINKGTHTNP